MDRKLVLANGKEFYGKAFGSTKEVISEVVFNTSCVGYQEIISDPSYTDQMICMTYPLIGNYGIIDEDYESKIFGPKAMIVREYNDKPSNFRYTKTLNEVMEENDIVGLTHIDTRYLTRTIREEGAMIGIICDSDMPKEKALEKIQAYDLPHNQIAKVSCKKRWYARCANPRFNVVAIDCGIKYNIIRDLNRNGCNVTIVPYNTSAKEILALKPDGIFLSNGPGDPQDVKEIVEVIKELQGIKPLFGICLGHQLIALANGFDTYKLKFGHRGANHPVLNIVTGRIEITSQNHSYAVKEKEDPNVKITHYNLLDKTVEGLEIAKDCCFSVQYHPESAAGPEDSKYLFKKFIGYMEQVKEKDNA